MDSKESIPEEWIDKLFNCLSQFYGERWNRYFEKPNILSMYKAIWRNALTGLNYEQIKQALVIFKRRSADQREFPPHMMEFYRVAKNVPRSEDANE